MHMEVIYYNPVQRPLFSTVAFNWLKDIISFMISIIILILIIKLHGVIFLVFEQKYLPPSPSCTARPN